MKDLHVVSFSGGKDSTAMLLRMLELGMQVDKVLYCDTTVEFPAMIEHINKVEQYIQRPIIKLSSNKSFEQLLLNETHINRKRQEIVGYSFPSMKVRWCTTNLKTNIINKYLKELKKEYNVIQYLGIASDEPKRVKDLNYPLAEWGWTEQQCLQYCYDKDFDFGGLYEIFNRVSCWCCPLKSLDELRKLRKNFPDLWQTLLEWQGKTWLKFRSDFSVDELEVRFALEDEWLAEGKCINPRKQPFKNELKYRVNLLSNI